MFKIENKNIYMNRGDTIHIKLENETDLFMPGDKVTFAITEKGNCNLCLYSLDTVVPTLGSDPRYIEITIPSSATSSPKFPIEKFRTGFNIYWYEIELSAGGEKTTLIGYDSDGPKLIYMYPEASQIPQHNGIDD